MNQEFITKLRGAYALFSCVGFELNYQETELRTTGGFHGATEAWDYARRNARQVYADIERRGEDWHLDVITNAYGSGRYDCWFASVYTSLEGAIRAMEWLSRENWKVLREAPRAPNTAAVLTQGQRAELAKIAPAKWDTLEDAEAAAYEAHQHEQEA